MAQLPAKPPESEDTFVDDRKDFFRIFTSATTGAVIVVAVILILLAVFLV